MRTDPQARQPISLARMTLIVVVLALTGAQTWCVLESMFDDVPQADRLFVAVSSGDLQEVQTLLRIGVSPMSRDLSGMTPLMTAAACGRNDMVEVLIASGAPLDSFDRYGLTPLLHAVRGGHVETVALLLRNSDASHRAESEEGALAFALRYDNEEVAAYLRTQMKIRPASFTHSREETPTHRSHLGSIGS